jgi:hypothetical protein
MIEKLHLFEINGNLCFNFDNSSDFGVFTQAEEYRSHGYATACEQQNGEHYHYIFYKINDYEQIKTVTIPFNNLFIPLCKFKHIKSGENIWIGNIDFNYISIKERTEMLLFLKDKIRKICDEDDIILIDNWNSDNK